MPGGQNLSLDYIFIAKHMQQFSFIMKYIHKNWYICVLVGHLEYILQPSEILRMMASNAGNNI